MASATAPFLTALDPRARVKGSRDPLGLVPVWSWLGREVVGNLTTVTTSVRNFTTSMLCQYLAEELIAQGKADEKERCALFLRAEQVLGYCRVAHLPAEEEGRVLGVTRLRQRLSHGTPRLRISESPEDQILADQRVYGLWGLYTVASRSSGLTEARSHGPSALARSHVEEELLDRIAPVAGPGLGKLLKLLEGGAKFAPLGHDEPLAKALASVLAPRLREAERAFYDATLLRGGSEDSTGGRQARLVDLMEEINAPSGPFDGGEGFGAAELDQLARLAAERGDEELATPLRRIRDIEPVLAVAEVLFNFLLTRETWKLEAVADDLDQRWPEGLGHVDVEAVEAARPQLTAALDAESAVRIVALARALREGRYRRCLELCREQNAAVMKARGGAPWVDESADGGLIVRLRTESGELPAFEELAELWYHPFFLGSLKSLTAEIRGAAH